MNAPRCRRLIDSALGTFGLDLSGLAILTEAATGYYMLTPMIAALAGANRVYALTRDSRYGSAREVCAQSTALAGRWGVAATIDVLFSREDERISQADIVTNLGFVRPLDAPFLRRLKDTAVIALMFEPWEYRPEDLDLTACRQLGIPVLGTNEQHPALHTFAYVGHLVLKLLFELDIEVYRSRVTVVGGGDFAEAAIRSLAGAGALVSHVDADKGQSLRENAEKGLLGGCDAIVVAEHRRREVIIGPGGGISAKELRSVSPDVALVHVAGNVDQEELRAADIPFRPPKLAPAGYMSVATDYLGPRPLVDLHAAGLRVGALLARARVRGLSKGEAEQEALVDPLCRALEDGHAMPWTVQ